MMFLEFQGEELLSMCVPERNPMLFTLDTQSCELSRVTRGQLSDIGWSEEKFQKLLFDHLESVLGDEDLVPLSRSRRWQEEPDIMAMDRNGHLYIFELKRWEAKEENLLQVLRYGQIYGQYSYEQLDEMFRRFYSDGSRLLGFLNNRFQLVPPLTESQVNSHQHFVVMTNGLDFRTRRAIQYWKHKNVDVRSWLYRIYKLSEGQVLVEFEKFRLQEDPDEDIEQGYYILNTNFSNSRKCDQDMLDHQKAAAYMDPWKYKIEKLKKGNRVFLYRSGEGLVAIGVASGILEKGPYPGKREHSENQFSMRLSPFMKLKRPMSASEIKEITETNHRFMSVMFGIDAKTGQKLWDHAKKERM